MSLPVKPKKITGRIIGDFKHELLGEKEKKPAPPKRSTMDMIMGKYPSPSARPAPEQVSPIVEAMLQTRESEQKEEESKLQQTDRMDLEISQRRRERKQMEKGWEEEQEKIMSSAESKEKDTAPALPSSPSKGPGAPKGKAQGIESFKRGKKN